MTTVLLVRHADIELPPHSDDPPLSSAGRERAETLAHVVGAARVTTVFTSSRLRTKQTAEPLVARIGVPPRETPPPAAFAQQVRSGIFGEMIMVVGHSNTVPQMMDALGVPPPLPEIGEREFDNLFVVTVLQPGPASMAHLKYGTPSM